MRKKVAALLVIIALLVPSFVGARNLVDVSLGFGAAYAPEEPLDFSLGMNDPDNYLFSGELSARVAFLQAQALVFPMTCSDDGQGVLLLGISSLSIPVLGPLLAFEIGAGVGVTYIPTSTDENSKSYYELADGSKVDAQQKSFTQAVWESPFYLQVGLGTEFGPIGFKLRYLLESRASVGTVLNQDTWWEVFDVEKGMISLALSLKMF
jgi:hypothetical protein